MSTPRDIILAAMGYSLKNNPNTIDARAVEFLDVVFDALSGLYSFAAEINPEYFAEKVNVNFAGSGWARPTKAEAVWRIEDANAKEVIIVPPWQRDADKARAAVYRLGQTFYSAGNTLDPVAGTLTFWYSLRATKPGSLDTAFDASWDTDFDGLLAVETAIYLAIQDGRGEEIQGLTTTRDRRAQSFAGFLQHETVNVVATRGNTRNINVPTLIKTFLAGGTG